MMQVFLPSFTVNKNVIKENKYKIMKFLVEYVVHAWLECGRWIFQAKRHGNKLKVTIVSSESSLWYVLFSLSNLMITWSKVNLWEELGPMELILGMGHLFFIFFLFNALKSMHILKVPSLFFTITPKEINGLELGLMKPNFKSSLMAS